MNVLPVRSSHHGVEEFRFGRFPGRSAPAGRRAAAGTPADLVAFAPAGRMARSPPAALLTLREAVRHGCASVAEAVPEAMSAARAFRRGRAGVPSARCNARGDIDASFAFTG